MDRVPASHETCNIHDALQETEIWKARGFSQRRGFVNVRYDRAALDGLHHGPPHHFQPAPKLPPTAFAAIDGSLHPLGDSRKCAPQLREYHGVATNHVFQRPHGANGPHTEFTEAATNWVKYMPEAPTLHRAGAVVVRFWSPPSDDPNIGIAVYLGVNGRSGAPKAVAHDKIDIPSDFSLDSLPFLPDAIAQPVLVLVHASVILRTGTPGPDLEIILPIAQLICSLESQLP